MINEYPFHFTAKDQSTVIVYVQDNEFLNFEILHPDLGRADINWKYNAKGHFSSFVALTDAGLEVVNAIIQEYLEHRNGVE
ncbi:MAG: hypothetical protein J0H46_01805 [Bacteroidetes bacterium]|nr:hypothetical protein [Bacteroidota bacterium]